MAILRNQLLNYNVNFTTKQIVYREIPKNLPLDTLYTVLEDERYTRNYGNRHYL